jgi:hypothetical protein
VSNRLRVTCVCQKCRFDPKAIRGLSRGDIGAVVFCYKDGAGFEVEFVTGKGETVAVITLEPKDVRPMHPNELLHAREIRACLMFFSA